MGMHGTLSLAAFPHSLSPPLSYPIQAAKIPHSDASIEEMFDIIDFNGDRVLDWKEWHDYISNQVCILHST